MFPSPDEQPDKDDEALDQRLRDALDARLDQAPLGRLRDKLRSAKDKLKDGGSAPSQDSDTE